MRLNDSPVESSGDQQPLQQDLRLSPEMLASLASSSVCVHRPRRRVSERRDMQAGRLAPMMMLMRSARRQAAHYAQLLRTNLALREEVWNAAEAEPDLLSPPLPHSSKTSSCKKKHSLLYLRPHFFPSALHTILSPTNALCIHLVLPVPSRTSALNSSILQGPALPNQKHARV